MLVVPFTSVSWDKFSTVLDGVEYGFRPSFNTRNGVWSFDLSLEKTGAVLAAGVPILIGCDMLAPYALGIGSLFAVDLAAVSAPETSGILPQSVDAGPDDLGTRVIVVYAAPGEEVP
jgi:hypothetical protein